MKKHLLITSLAMISFVGCSQKAAVKTAINGICSKMPVEYAYENLGSEFALGGYGYGTTTRYVSDPSAMTLVFENPNFLSDAKNLFIRKNEYLTIEQGGAFGNKHSIHMIEKKQKLEDDMIAYGEKHAPSMVNTCKQYYSKLVEECGDKDLKGQAYAKCAEHYDTRFEKGLYSYMTDSLFKIGKVDMTALTYDKLKSHIDKADEYVKHAEKIENECILPVYKYAHFNTFNPEKLAINVSYKNREETQKLNRVVEGFFTSDYVKELEKIRAEDEITGYVSRARVKIMWHFFEPHMKNCVSKVGTKTVGRSIASETTLVPDLTKWEENGTLDLNLVNTKL